SDTSRASQRSMAQASSGAFGRRPKLAKWSMRAGHADILRRLGSLGATPTRPGEHFFLRATAVRDRREGRACRAARMRDGEQIDEVAQRALVAPLDAELVAAPRAQQQVPPPGERQVRPRDERAISLVALAGLVSEPDGALRLRSLRGVGS